MTRQYWHYSVWRTTWCMWLPYKVRWTLHTTANPYVANAALKAYLFSCKQTEDGSRHFPKHSLCSRWNNSQLILTNDLVFYLIGCSTLTCLVFSSSLQRSDIVKAAYEPTDEECEWKADEEEELTVSKQVQVTYTPACFLSDWTLLPFPFHCMHVVYSLTQNKLHKMATLPLHADNKEGHG